MSIDAEKLKDLKAWAKVGPVLADRVTEEMANATEARNVARMVWMMFSYREKEERDKQLCEWIKQKHPWIMDESE